MQHLGWTDLINTHMSARVPGEPNAFLINSYGEMFDEVTASSLVKMDLDGQRPRRRGGRFNAAGFTIHSGVYKARPDAKCVLHTHTRAGAGLSLLRQGLRPISQDALHVLDDVAYHEYGVPASKEECEELGVTCAQGSCVVLLNHGLLTLGPDHPRRADAALHARTRLRGGADGPHAGRAAGDIEPEVVEKAAARMKKLRATPEYGLLEFQGLVRTVDRKGAKYRC